jgi:hypothetical protein
MRALAVLSIKITINCVMMTLASLRLYIIRFKMGRKNVYDNLSHILIFSAIMADNVACGTSVWILRREIDTINAVGHAEAQHLVATHKNLTILYWSNLSYYISLCIIKLAYLALYAQMFNRLQGWRKSVLWVAGAIWALAYIAGFLMIFLWCLPFGENMVFPPTNPHCPMMFTVTAFTTLAGVNLVSDFAVASVPLILLGTMQKRQRAGMLFVLGVASISIIASVARLWVVIIRIAAHRMDWDSTHVMMLWNHAEIFFGVFAFMLPSFRFMARKLPERFSWFRSQSKGSSGSGDIVTIGHARGSPRSPPRLFSAWTSTEKSHLTSDGGKSIASTESPHDSPNPAKVEEPGSPMSDTAERRYPWV